MGIEVLLVEVLKRSTTKVEDLYETSVDNPFCRILSCCGLLSKTISITITIAHPHYFFCRFSDLKYKYVVRFPNVDFKMRMIGEIHPIYFVANVKMKEKTIAAINYFLCIIDSEDSTPIILSSV